MKTKLDWGQVLGHLSPYNLKKAFLYLRHFGLKGFVAKLTDRFEKTEVDYADWRLSHIPAQEELEAQRKRAYPGGKKYSILVPLYQTPEMYLRHMIESVCAQTYGNWELCLADASPCLDKANTPDESCMKVQSREGGLYTSLTDIVQEYAKKDHRIQYQILRENAGISNNTNRAAEMAEGEFLCFLDHDDTLSPDALYELALALEKHPDAELFYSDEDKVSADEKDYFLPHFKPDFNPDLLRSNNYICHFLCVSKNLAEKVGMFDEAYDGAQDYDFILRCTERAKEITHIPKVLYHWRVHSASTADNPFSKDFAYEAGKRALEAHLKRCGLKGQVERLKDAGFYRIRYETSGEPLVSIIIPNKDHLEELKNCVSSIWDKSTYTNIEIIVVENNSEEDSTFSYYKELEQKAAKSGRRLRIVTWQGTGFNYPSINNFGVTQAQGEYLILLNNDITVITPNWIQEFLGFCSRPDTAVVGARLYYPDNRIQHAGIVIGIGGIAGSLFVDLPRERGGYMHKAALIQDFSAVTAACMMVKKSIYQELSGMDEALAVAFNDVDFCLRVRKRGYLVVYDPFVEMYHHESRSRGAEDTTEKIRRFQREIEFMRTRWIRILKEGDPYYNPNLSLKTWNYELK